MGVNKRAAYYTYLKEQKVVLSPEVSFKAITDGFFLVLGKHSEKEIGLVAVTIPSKGTHYEEWNKQAGPVLRSTLTLRLDHAYIPLFFTMHPETYETTSMTVIAEGNIPAPKGFMEFPSGSMNVDLLLGKPYSWSVERELFPDIVHIRSTKEVPFLTDKHIIKQGEIRDLEKKPPW